MTETTTAVQFPIEMYGVYPDTRQYGARIKRFDDLVYEPSTGTFKPEDQIADPFIPLVRGAGNEQTLLSAKVQLDPAQFADGDYRVYFHETDVPTKMIVSEAESQVFNGTWFTPKPVTRNDLAGLATKAATDHIDDTLAHLQSSFLTDVAMRIMSITIASHTKPKTLGLHLNKMERQLDYICDYIQQQTGKPKPV